VSSALGFAPSLPSLPFDVLSVTAVAFWGMLLGDNILLAFVEVALTFGMFDNTSSWPLIPFFQLFIRRQTRRTWAEEPS
jgi:hypothetical protein